MKASLKSKRIAGVLALAVFSLCPAALVAQDQSQASLTLQDVKNQLKQNKNYLEQASKQGKAANAAGMQTALDNYDRGMEGLNTALSQGKFSGTASQQENALSRVQNATSKHIKVLQGLLSKVPAQAQGAIQHAINVSQKGHDMATASLQTSRGQHQTPSGQPDGFGRPSGVGPGADHPSGVGGPAGFPGGRPSGRPGRP